MTVNINGTASTALTWSMLDSTESSLVDRTQRNQYNTFGTSDTNYVNSVFVDVDTLASSGEVLYDLQALNRDVFSTTLNVSFSSISAVYLYHISGAGNLTFGGASGTPFEPFVTPGSEVYCYPNSHIEFSDFTNTFSQPVDGSNNELRVYNGSSDSIQYGLYVVGSG